MGIFSGLRLVKSVDEMSRSHTRLGISSPWSTGSLEKVVWEDIFGADVAVPTTREAAMAVPAMARARNKVVTAIAKSPLKAYRAADELPAQPAWLYRTNGQTSPAHRMAWTVDDLIFGGWSLWLVERGSEGQITDAVRCPAEDWIFGGDGEVIVGDEPVDEQACILIPGFHEGVLATAADSIRTARQLEQVVLSRALNPLPALDLHQTADMQLEDDEIDDMIDDARAQLQRTGGAVFSTPAGIEPAVFGDRMDGANLLVEGRNASAVDMARAVGIPASMIDASGVNSTLTYETLASRNLQFLDDLDLYFHAIEARLSMDDVCPRGTRIAFDRSDLTVQVPSPSGAPTED